MLDCTKLDHPWNRLQKERKTKTVFRRKLQNTMQIVFKPRQNPQLTRTEILFLSTQILNTNPLLGRNGQKFVEAFRQVMISLLPNQIDASTKRKRQRKKKRAFLLYKTQQNNVVSRGYVGGSLLAPSICSVCRLFRLHQHKY